jgi:hypothetical protein
MQPEASPKPVMDVMPPRATPGMPGPATPPAPAIPAPEAPHPAPVPPAPAPPKPDVAPLQSLSVHEAPKLSEAQASPAGAKLADVSAPPAKEPVHHNAESAKSTESKPAKAKTMPKAGAHLQAPPLPVGAIVAAIIVMVLLAGLAVAAYLTK